jgi:predicted transcriptional regulator
MLFCTRENATNVVETIKNASHNLGKTVITLLQALSKNGILLHYRAAPIKVPKRTEIK